MEYYILKLYKEEKKNNPEIEQGFDRFEPRLKIIIYINFIVLIASCLATFWIVINYPGKLWFLWAFVGAVFSGIDLLIIDDRNEREHLDMYAESYKKKIKILNKILRKKFKIDSKDKIEELINNYQEFVDKEKKKEKKRNHIIWYLLSICGGILAISFTNMQSMNINFTTWLYLAVDMLLLFGGINILIYFYGSSNLLKREYEIMIKDLKNLLILKY